MIDMEEDYGKYVVGPLEWALAGSDEEARWEEVKTVHAAPAYITPAEMAQVFQQGVSNPRALGRCAVLSRNCVSVRQDS